jgi:hypothetical protein
MASDPDWLSWYWLGFGVSIVFGVLLLATAYGARDDRRKRKFIQIQWVYWASAAVYGALALGQTWIARNDGYKILWGRWALYAATHWAVVGVFCVSMTGSKSLQRIGMILALIQSLCTLFMVLTPSQFVPHDNNAYNSLALWTSLAAFFTAVLFVFLFSVAMDWWKRWREQESALTADTRNVMAESGSQSRWSLALVAVVAFVLLALYPILAAVGPEGFRVSTDYSLEMFLTLLLADGLTKFIALPLVYFIFNPDGFNVGTPYAIVDSAPTEGFEDPARILQSLNKQIGAGVHGQVQAQPVQAQAQALPAPVRRFRYGHYSPQEMDQYHQLQQQAKHIQSQLGANDAF